MQLLRCCQDICVCVLRRALISASNHHPHTFGALALDTPSPLLLAHCTHCDGRHEGGKAIADALAILRMHRYAYPITEMANAASISQTADGL